MVTFRGVDQRGGVEMAKVACNELRHGTGGSGWILLAHEQI
jgi:hypothetical protein